MAFYWVTFLLYFVDIVAYLLAPFFQQIYTDNIITRKNPEWFGPLMACYILLFLLELGVWMSMNLLRRRHFTKMGLLSSSRFVLSILELPMLTLDRFTSGELVARYSGIKNLGAHHGPVLHRPLVIVSVRHLCLAADDVQLETRAGGAAVHVHPRHRDARHG